MANVVIRPLLPDHLHQLPTIITSYTTTARYAIKKVETQAETVISLKLESLPVPQIIKYNHLDEVELARLADIVAAGLSVGAFVDDTLVGVAIGSVEAWNSSLRVWEFHVAEPFQRQGIGRKLMEKMVETAVSHNFRVIVCETQSNNVPAICVYRKLGFELDAIDLSFYSNEDLLQQRVAIFMKRKL